MTVNFEEMKRRNELEIQMRGNANFSYDDTYKFDDLTQKYKVKLERAVFGYFKLVRNEYNLENIRKISKLANEVDKNPDKTQLRILTHAFFIYDDIVTYNNFLKEYNEAMEKNDEKSVNDLLEDDFIKELSKNLKTSLKKIDLTLKEFLTA